MQHLVLKFLKFGVVGVIGTGVDFGVTWLLKERLGLNKYIANSCGFATAVVSNFILNRLWIESHNPHVAVQFGKFAAVALVGLAINNSIIYLSDRTDGFSVLLLQTCCNGRRDDLEFWR